MNGNGARRRPGRPRSAARTQLIRSLTGRQDAMARRTAGRIAGIHDRYVDLGASRAEFDAYCRDVVRPLLGALPARLVAAVPAGVDVARIRPVVAQVVADALACLAGHGLGDPPGAPPGGQPPQVPRVRRSRSLAAARAQVADLQVVLLDLRARIVRR